MFVIRSMLPSDISAVLAIQEQAYVDEVLEDEHVIRERLIIAPETAWVIESENDVHAYLVGYPSTQGSLTALGDFFAPAREPDCLYLHDLAVASTAAGRGYAAALIHHAMTAASNKGLNAAALISVQNSVGFWQRHGFEVVSNLDESQQARLQTYAGPAFYMQNEALLA